MASDVNAIKRKKLESHIQVKFKPFAILPPLFLLLVFHATYAIYKQLE